jgi:hypothetical protein
VANNLGLDLFAAGVTLHAVGGITNNGLDLFVAGVLYPGDTDGNAAGGGSGGGGGGTTVGLLLLGVG